jgi:uncharacterized protein (UPF0332 family)
MFALIQWLRAWWGYDEYSAETVDRLARSKHVADLRGVAWVTVVGALVAIILIIVVNLMDRPAGSKLYESFVPVSAVLAVVGTILAWCYRTGSARLGIVDLFACEITTVCRICTINALADTCIKAFELDSSQNEKIRQHFSQFESSEDYTPIFDSNAKELQNLDVKVVTNITAFYTYWKSARDAARKLAKTPEREAVAAGDMKSDASHQTIRHVIYLQFLTLESARRAVRDLIEFQPTNAENTITILLSELPLYGFLLNRFKREPHDVRHARLKLRQERYRDVVPKVYYDTKRGYAKYENVEAVKKEFPRRKGLEELGRDWAKAYRMLEQLRSHYEDAMSSDLPPEPPAVLAPR